MSEAITVLLVDDELTQREGLRRLFQWMPRVRLVGVAAGFEEALRLASQSRPEVVMTDISLAGDGDDDIGAKLIVRLKEELPNLKFLAISGYKDGRRSATAAGAHLVVSRVAIHSAAALEQYIIDAFLAPDPSPSAMLHGDDIARERRRNEVLALLTEAEKRVFFLRALGYSDRQIAEELTLSEKTIGNHLLKIHEKLGVHSKGELIAFAHRHGLIDDWKPLSQPVALRNHVRRRS